MAAELETIAVPGLWISLSAVMHLAGFVLVVFHCLRYRREATSAILWMFVAWSFPVVGPALFLSFGINRVQVKGWKKHEVNQRFLQERRARESSPEALECWRRVRETFAAKPETDALHDLRLTMNSLLPDAPLLTGNSIEILVTGDQAYGPMLHAVTEATHHVHLQTFILGRDHIGREFLELLASKARSGVAVRIMYDSFGSSRARLTGFLRRFRNVPGMQMVSWSQVSPLKRQFQVNLRNHRKLLIVDGRRAFAGGINIHEQNVSKPNRPAIRDYHFALGGPIVHELQYSFLTDWHFMTHDQPGILLRKEHFPADLPCGNSPIRLVNAGPTAGVEVLTDVLCASLAAARSRILAVTPYFVPTPDILRALRLAALRGVDVRLVLPRKSNHPSAALASHALYEGLLCSGVRIYHRPPPFLHAKALIVDSGLAIIGSANLDARSLRLNYETNMAVFDPAFVHALENAVQEDLAVSREILLPEWRRRPRVVQMTENFCGLLSPVL